MWPHLATAVGYIEVARILLTGHILDKWVKVLKNNGYFLENFHLWLGPYQHLAASSRVSRKGLAGPKSSSTRHSPLLSTLQVHVQVKVQV